MAEARCECCDLPVAMCGRAAESRLAALARAERARLLALPGVWAAEFPGVCPACRERIEPTDPICRGPEPRTYVHAACRHPF